MAPPPRPMPMPAAMTLPLHHHHLLLVAPMHESQHTREEKEKTVHNRQRPARLEHRTRLAQLDPITPKRDISQQRKASRVRSRRRQTGAVIARDAAERVDAPDEGADEGEVDEGDEAGVVFGAVVGEERADCPDDGEDDDDEEDEDGVGGEGVGGYVEVDEPGEHAYCWDLGGGC
ncbi:hypothetical protein V502_02930 [Pseudogymnoascus sp. VKM F-4520 (FW-2644)]|nr:hypothetical protein V502_02930 [Pseudogymnoascus sp. VKM F-4520 (FW-2644)]